MSMPHSIIYCDSCDYRGMSYVVWGLFKYRFDDWHESAVRRELGWCTDCASVRPMESLPHPAVLERELTEVRGRLQPLRTDRFWSRVAAVVSRKRRSEIQSLRDRESDLLHQQAMIASRTSPARCLRCGSTAVTPMAVRVCGNKAFDEDAGMSHPGCGGALRVRNAEVRLHLSHKLQRYTPEGELIP